MMMAHKLLLIYFVVLGFELRAYTLNHWPALYVMGFF
jgi:hypothetical protein